MQDDNFSLQYIYIQKRAGVPCE